MERAEAALMQAQIERLLQIGELIRHELDPNASHSQADLPHGATAAPRAAPPTGCAPIPVPRK